jgi:CBS domain-containing protein
MTPNPVTCPADATVADVARLMKERDIGDVLVADGDTITGIATDRDIVVRAVAEGRDGNTPIAEIASQDVVTLAPDDDMTEAVETMRSRSIRRLPVCEGGKPVGIVSLGDLAMERDDKSALAHISAAPGNT